MMRVYIADYKIKQICNSNKLLAIILKILLLILNLLKKLKLEINRIL